MWYRPLQFTDSDPKIWSASRVCVSSFRRGHANLLCIDPILVGVPPKRTQEHREILGAKKLWYDCTIDAPAERGMKDVIKFIMLFSLSILPSLKAWCLLPLLVNCIHSLTLFYKLNSILMLLTVLGAVYKAVRSGIRTHASSRDCDLNAAP